MNALIVAVLIVKRWVVQILVNLIGRKIPMSVRLFDKTPAGVVCPHFYILSWARGCPHGCSYCYLGLTHRFHGTKPHSYSWPRIEKAIDNFFAEHEEPALLNTGELADSLMNPALMEKICDKFEEQSTHKVLLLSKGCRLTLNPLKDRAIDFLCKKKYKQTIVSFSVNAHEFAELYEKRAPNIYQRLRCALWLIATGYKIRLRIDPIIPLKPSNAVGYSWKTAYRDHVKFMLKTMHVTPTRITLGTPRWFPALPYWLKRAGRKDNFFDNFSRNKVMCCDGRYRLKNRAEVYAYLIRTLRKYHYEGPIALCKETVDVWQVLRNFYDWDRIPLNAIAQGKIRCNCTF